MHETDLAVCLFLVGSFCTIFSCFLCSVLQIVVCPFVPFPLSIVLCVFLRIVDTDYKG
jgi:hypothetical protein